MTIEAASKALSLLQTATKQTLPSSSQHFINKNFSCVKDYFSLGKEFRKELKLFRLVMVQPKAKMKEREREKTPKSV
jgi:hypothetical protein